MYGNKPTMQSPKENKFHSPASHSGVRLCHCSYREEKKAGSVPGAPAREGKGGDLGLRSNLELRDSHVLGVLLEENRTHDPLFCL